MIPVYNCSSYLREAIISVLDQDFGEKEMQIEVVDDASTDADVKMIVDEVGYGRVTYFRQPYNVGSLRNFETCIQRANGYLVHLLHGDDRVRIGYYQKIGELFKKFPEAGAAFTNNSAIDSLGNFYGTAGELMGKDGILQNWLNTIAQMQRLQYVAITVKRNVYEKLGSFYAVTYGEDWEMWVRIAKNYPTAYSPEVLADYRLHFNSISGGAYKKGKNIEDLSCVIKLIHKQISEADQVLISKTAKQKTAYHAIEFAKQFIWPGTRNKKIVLWQVFQILKLYRDKHLFIQCFRLVYSVLRWK
jgi:glycosyltransferase involved in cell wall biosynthesis